MYNSHDIATSIKQRAKVRNVVIKTMLEKLGLGSNTMSAMYHGKAIASDSLARIADYLDCSVDYLLGRTDVPEVNRRGVNATSRVSESPTAPAETQAQKSIQTTDIS